LVLFSRQLSPNRYSILQRKPFVGVHVAPPGPAHDSLFERYFGHNTSFDLCGVDEAAVLATFCASVAGIALESGDETHI
jgi:hypothetical protein